VTTTKQLSLVFAKTMYHGISWTEIDNVGQPNHTQSQYNHGVNSMADTSVYQ
jgi:hypothetical protein